MAFFLIQTSRWRDCIPWRQESCISDLSAVLKKVYGVRTWDWEEKEKGGRTRHERPLLKEGISRSLLGSSSVGLILQSLESYLLLGTILPKLQS